jgi:hypothetical protein
MRCINYQTCVTISLCLKVLFYPGVKELTSGSRVPDGDKMRLLDADYLSTFDIIVTTFDVLNRDLSHTDNCFITESAAVGARHAGFSLRRQKKYRVVPSPLACLEFWRYRSYWCTACVCGTKSCSEEHNHHAGFSLRRQKRYRVVPSPSPVPSSGGRHLEGTLIVAVLQRSPSPSPATMCPACRTKSLRARMVSQT